MCRSYYFQHSTGTYAMKDNWWNAFLLLKTVVRDWERFPGYCFLELAPPWRILVDRLPESTAQGVVVQFRHSFPSRRPPFPLFQWVSLSAIRCLDPVWLKEEEIALFRVYLPFCLLSPLAIRAGRCLGVAHFAQSLDGRISTLKGHSKWIGNQANLVHAHRMRALCEGILVGKQTLLTDRPRLTVRHVAGRAPRRIIIGSGITEVECLREASREPVWIFSNQAEAEPHADGVRRFSDTGQPGPVSCAFVMRTLYEEGIHSVLIEGGPHTSSRFLKAGLLDVIQLHIAPMLLGSGRSAFVLPEIDQIDEAVAFDAVEFYKMDEAYMFSGEPIRK